MMRLSPGSYIYCFICHKQSKPASRSHRHHHLQKKKENRIIISHARHILKRPANSGMEKNEGP